MFKRSLILSVIVMLFIATNAFAEVIKTYTLEGQWDWVNSPAGSLLMTCSKNIDRGVGTWHATGNKGMRTLRFEGLYKVTDDVFEMRRAVKGNMGQDTMETVVKGSWKVVDDDRGFFIIVENKEDDDLDTDHAIFRKIVMRTYKMHQEKKYTKLKDFLSCMVDRTWNFTFKAKYDRILYSTRIYLNKNGSYIDFKKEFSGNRRRLKGTWTVKGNNITLKPNTGESFTLTFLEGRSTEGVEMRYMDLKNNRNGEKIEASSHS